MSNSGMGGTGTVAASAFAGAALFVALIVAFSAAGTNASASGWVLVIGALGVASHLVLLPVVAAIEVAPWARAGGYAWIFLDAMLNIATVNGADIELVSTLRLGGHVAAAVWIARASAQTGGAVQMVGVPLAMVLALHAFAAPWVPLWVIYIPFVTIPVWLTLVGRALRTK